MMHTIDTEHHPLTPFIPNGARVLMLGSFPPGRERWSMDFFYPNWINDMWRIIGLIFYGDKHHFEITGERRFDREKIMTFCATNGIALYDAAVEVRRLKANASDKFLEVVSHTDITRLIDYIPECRAIITTGEKAAEIVAEQFGVEIPAVGNSVAIHFNGRTLALWRTPSTSRAYPLALDRKADIYRVVFERYLDNSVFYINNPH